MFNNPIYPLLLLLIAFVPTQGYFSYYGFILVTIVLLYFLAIFIRKSSKNEIYQTHPFFFIGILFFSAISYQGIFHNIDARVMVKLLVLGLTGYIFISQFILKKNTSIIFLLLVYIFISVFVVTNSPDPKIDVYYLLKESPMALFQGKDPYAIHYTQLYPNTSNDLGYLPSSLIYLFPFVVIFNDPRFGLIFAKVISALILYKLLKKNGYSNLLISCFLFFPQTFNILEFSYLEPMLLMFLLLFIYFFINRKLKFSFIFLGLFFSFKHNYFIYLPHILSKIVRRQSIKAIFLFFIPFIFTFIFLYQSSAMYKNITPPFINRILIPYLPEKFATLASQNTTPITDKVLIPPYYQALSVPAAMRHLAPNMNVELINKYGLILLVFFWLIILTLKLSFMDYLIATTIVYNYFFYHSFMNNYYFLAQLILLSIIFNAGKIKFEFDSNDRLEL